MKNTDLLDVIGEVNAAYYEDMARNLSGRSVRIRRVIARFGAAAAVIGVMTVTAVTFASVFREGIQTTQQPANSGMQTASTDTQSTALSESSKPEQTMRTDLYEVMQTTTVTTTSEPVVTTTELILPFPADAEMPSNDLRQAVGSRFLVNWMSKSGVLAMTLNDVQLYDSLEDAGLTFDNLTESFREAHQNARDYYEKKSGSFMVDSADGVALYMFDPDGGEENLNNWFFIKGTLTVENINAVSGWKGITGLTYPDGSPVMYSDFDFGISGFGFGVLPNADPEKSNGKSYFGKYAFQAGMEYNQAEGMFYQDSYRRKYIHLEPGEAISFEVGAFLPKVYTEYMNQRYPLLQYEVGTDLRSYYMFGGQLFRPFVEISFDE